MIVLLSLTVNQKVAQDEYAVTYNKYTQTFGDKIYDQGSYTVKVGDDFIKFKRTLQNLIVGDIFCMSRDKIILELEVAIQYELNAHSIVPFILKQFSNYDAYIYFLQKIAKSTISNVCANFDAEQYYNLRTQIDTAMFNQLKIDINTTVGSTIEFFQLVDIIFPIQYASIIVAKQNIQQNINTARNQRDSSITAANTTLFQAQLSADVIIANSNYTAQVTINNAYAFQNITLTKWDQRTFGFNYTKNRLDLNQSEFIDYLKSELLRSSPDSYVQLPGI